jgi:RNA recognition motif-containing protein
MDLKDLGRKYGDITYSDANRIGDREGLITYATKKDMVNAYESMKGLEFMGRDLELEYEFPETAEDDWTGDANNDHPQGDSKDGNYGAKAGSRSPAAGRGRSKSPSNDRFRDRSRSRSYSR